jgi:hypothetical protein
VLVARRQHVFQMAGNVSIAVKSVQERGRHEPLVVLVDTLGAPHGLLWQFFAIGGTPRDVRPLVFYSGRADSVILTRFSSRIPLRVRWTGPDHPPALLELGRISRPSGEN